MSMSFRHLKRTTQYSYIFFNFPLFLQVKESYTSASLVAMYNERIMDGSYTHQLTLEPKISLQMF